MERTIALTGATGFLGQAVVERLLEEPSLKLRCLVREGRNPKGLDERGPRVEIVPGDVCAPKTLGPLLEGAWGVINLAGLRGFWARATKDYYDMTSMVGDYPNVHVNVNLTSVLLRQLIDYYVERFDPFVDVEASTMDVDGFLAAWDGNPASGCEYV